MEWGLFGAFGVFWLVGVVVWIWALVDAIRVPDDSQFKSGTKLIWVLVIVLASVIGAIIYVLAGRPDGGATKAIADWNARGGRAAPPAVGSPPPPPPPPPPASV